MSRAESEPRPGATGAALQEDHSGSRSISHADAPGQLPLFADQRGAGEALKLAAMLLHYATNGDPVRLAQRVAVRLLADSPDGITIDDVRDALGELPDRDPRWLGAVMHGLRVAGVVRRADYVLSSRAIAHRRPVALWVERVPGAAAAWLQTHGR